jgi:hypothetical protein
MIKLRALLAMLVLLGACAGCGKLPTGTAWVSVLDKGLRSVTWVRLAGEESLPTCTISNLAPVVSAALPAGRYRVILGFSNSNYRPPTEVEVGVLQVVAGRTNGLACGMLSFDVRRDLPDLDLNEVIVYGRNGAPTVRLNNTGNTYYFFEPKPLPPGTYDVAISYYRSSGPSVMATGLVVRAGAETVVAFNTGFALRRPEQGGVQGWSLTREGASTPWLTVRRGMDNDEPLWRRFMVPPGRYLLSVKWNQSSAPADPETVLIEPGLTMTYALPSRK